MVDVMLARSCAFRQSKTISGEILATGRIDEINNRALDRLPLRWNRPERGQKKPAWNRFQAGSVDYVILLPIVVMMTVVAVIAVPAVPIVRPIIAIVRIWSVVSIRIIISRIANSD